MPDLCLTPNWPSLSVACGFASRDSDYDVRFLYVHRRDWYLAVEDRRDVIEQPIANDLDVSGWDSARRCGCSPKSNPPLLEWLKSPVVHRHDPVFAAVFGALAAELYCRSGAYTVSDPRPTSIDASVPSVSPRLCFAHYLHMAYGNWRDYLRGRKEVSLKKSLYVFRPPMIFAQLVEINLPPRFPDPSEPAGSFSNSLQVRALPRAIHLCRE